MHRGTVPEFGAEAAGVAYLLGLSPAERKKGWQLAEQASDAIPDRVDQRQLDLPRRIGGFGLSPSCRSDDGVVPHRFDGWQKVAKRRNTRAKHSIVPAGRRENTQRYSAF